MTWLFWWRSTAIQEALKPPLNKRSSRQPEVAGASHPASARAMQEIILVVIWRDAAHGYPGVLQRRAAAGGGRGGGAGDWFWLAVTADVSLACSSSSKTPCRLAIGWCSTPVTARHCRGPDDQVLCAPARRQGLVQLVLSGQIKIKVTNQSGNLPMFSPQFSPDDKFDDKARS